MYLKTIRLVPLNTFFENGGDPNPGGTPPAQTPPADSGTPKTYTEDEFKIALENEKKARKEETTKLISQLEEIKKSKGLSDNEKASLEDQIRNLNNSLLSKEELAKQERAKLEREAKQTEETLKAERDLWKSRFEDSMIHRAITDAANSAQAFDPEMFVTLHRSSTVIEEVKDDSGKVINFNVKTKVLKTENGETKELVMTPKELVAYLKEQPDRYGFLFKGEGRGGMGGGNTSPELSSLDFKNMTVEQYAKYRGKLGLGNQK